MKLEADVVTIKQEKAKTPEELLMLPSVAALPVVATLRQELADKESKFKAESQLRGLQQSLNRRHKLVVAEGKQCFREHII